LSSTLKMKAVCCMDFVICNIVNSKSQQVEDCLDQNIHAVSQPSRHKSDNSEVLQWSL
jgi:hypothetical protein